MSFVSPAPGATRGRVDQGVDWSNVKSIVAVAQGKIVQVYGNLQGFGQTIIERLQSGQEVYYGEETAGGAAIVKPGQNVQQGQQIATAKGGVIEVGYWDPSTGRSAGAPYFTGSNPTPPGQQFLGQIGGGTAGQKSTLAQLWIDAGGDPRVANIMAAIAMAESAGVATAVQKGQPYATTGWGLWQITPGNSVPSIGTDQQLLDPLTNARAAVAKYNAQGLGAWTTYTSGAYKQFMGKANRQKYSLSRPGGQAPGSGSSGGGSSVADVLTGYTNLRDMPRTAPTKPGAFQWWWQSFSGNWADLTTPQGTSE